jgi:hypothetical protein
VFRVLRLVRSSVQRTFRISYFRVENCISEADQFSVLVLHFASAELFVKTPAKFHWNFLHHMYD